MYKATTTEKLTGYLFATAGTCPLGAVAALGSALAGPLMVASGLALFFGFCLAILEP